MHRSKRAIGLDLKADEGVEAFLRLVESADAVFEVFRPGVAERLGIGPDVCRARNPRLVYGRLTGWGQAGPLAQEAGHDLDYLAVAGALEPLGRAGQPPTAPINVLGDFAGGGMLLAFGIVAALLERAALRGGPGDRRGDGRRRRARCSPRSTAHARRARGGRAARTSSTRARRSTTCTRPPTARGSRSARSSRSSTLRCSTASASPMPTFPGSTTATAGRCCGSASRPCCGPAPATSGSRTSPAGTRASRPCSRRSRRPTIRTTAPAGRSSRSPVCRSPRPHRTSHARPCPPPRPPEHPGATTADALAPWGFPSTEVAALQNAGVLV